MTDCPSTGLHGTRYAYERYRCRCPEAREANAARRRGRRPQRIKSEPTLHDCPSRRTHGTAWALEEYGCRCPEAVADAQAKWRNSAQRKSRWKRPAEYSPATAGDGIVDEVVVERLAQGQDVPATKAERDAAYRLLERRGLVAREIAERLQLSTRTVVRRRVAA
jgi:hypothetical protein